MCDFKLTTWNFLFDCFRERFNLKSRKSWRKVQALKFCMNLEVNAPYASAADILLHVNWRFTIGKLNSYFFDKFCNQPTIIVNFYLIVELWCKLNCNVTVLKLNQVQRLYPSTKQIANFRRDQTKCIFII